MGQSLEAVAPAVCHNSGALIGMGVPEYEAKRYEGRVKDGGILLSVHSDDFATDEEGKGDLGAHRRTGCFIHRRSKFRKGESGFSYQ